MRLALAAILSLLIAPNAAIPETASKLQVGATAPEFTVADSNGQKVTLSSFKGKTVVLEWSNPDCPYVQKHYITSNMQTLQREAKQSGIVWLTLLSTAPGKMGYMQDIEVGAWLEKQKAEPVAYLLDTDARAANAYDVKLALTMFVIDPQGKLVYQGAIDDKPTAKPADVKGARNYVREAMAAAISGKPMLPATTRPYGCFAR